MTLFVVMQLRAPIDSRFPSRPNKGKDKSLVRVFF